MTRGLILAAHGFSESHGEYAYHRLREDAVLVDIASPDGGTIAGDDGNRWETVAMADVPPGRRYDLVVIPGGDTSAVLSDDDATRRWLSAYLERGGIVCAVGEGVGLLSAIGAIDGRLVTGPADRQAELEASDAIVTGEAVTVDGPFVTVRDTEALPFGIAAALGNVVIPQGRATEATERPHWTTSDATDR